MRIAMLGTRGVPARYGGFETAVEEVGRRLVERGHDVVVYCRGTDPRPAYQGMRRVVLPAVRGKTTETLSHTVVSAGHLLGHRTDVALVFNAANAPVLPMLRAARIPVAVHVDGLEWQRAKWGPRGRQYYRLSERLAVRWADALIADSIGIQEYYRQVHRADTTFLAYGAPILHDPPLDRLAELGLTPQGYHLVVARLEPENNVHLAVQAHLAGRATLPLVVVGSVSYAGPYAAWLQDLAGADDRIRMVGAVWDQELLDVLYAGSATYIHGHSVGGTNPSLLRALGAAAPVIAYDVTFNREVLNGSGLYFSTSEELAQVVSECEREPVLTAKRGVAGRDDVAERYTWDQVTLGYERLCEQLAAGS